MAGMENVGEDASDWRNVGKTQAIGQEGRREAKQTLRDRARHGDEVFFLDR